MNNERRLDVELADYFMFYRKIVWYEKSGKEVTGIPFHNYDGHRQLDERDRKTIPYYSTNDEAFSEIYRRCIEFKVYELFIKFLADEGQDEITATLNQKCVAILKAIKNKPKTVSSSRSVGFQINFYPRTAPAEIH
jgi:hypothetical protein